MIGTELGRLENVDLREVFASEAGDFTPWLAREENLALLGASIGVRLELEAQEKQVGLFRADILCRDSENEQWVLVENQIERTDHTHLGQLLTYAAGLDAVTIVWIAERFTAEHRAALNWLNEKTDEGINFFGLEMELWRIGDSPVAPRFNVVCGPDVFRKSTKGSFSGVPGKLTRSQVKLQFWLAFRDYMSAQKSLPCDEPAPQYWLYHPINRKGARLYSALRFKNLDTGVNERTQSVGLELVGAQARSRFSALERQREEIERALGCDLVWDGDEGNSELTIRTNRPADYTDEALWPEQMDWLRTTLERFKEVFVPKLDSIDSSSAQAQKAAAK